MQWIASEANRNQLTAVIERLVQAGAAMQADKKSGQTSLFGAFEDPSEDDAGSSAPTPLPDMDEWPEREKLIAEKEVLGFYLASHPLSEFEAKLSTFRSHTTDRLADIKDRGEVILGGMISSIKFSHTKNSKPGSTHQIRELRLRRYARVRALYCLAKKLCGLRRKSSG